MKKIVNGEEVELTEEEEQEVLDRRENNDWERKKRIMEIDKRLEEIDKFSARPKRAIEAAKLKGQPEPQKDAQILLALEEEAETLRIERRDLEA